MGKRVELLAPAGGYETMVGAFNAGADAVYLGGSKFGARAYADNFDRDQVLDAISYAHLHGKKIYMTVNTLVKEREFGELYDFMLPFAQRRLDGVIVQDYGVMRFIRDEFPQVELHASTQQTITGVHGAKLLKELGCCRVVPARELSLYEMKAIRTEADVEVEAFIHGAMCYCYSGACLFSSMVGTRSGNRGRCAQPCRLPYQLLGTGAQNQESYPLSLKDMCTIDMIPELIEAGIDSFKIEGRMKKPEYAAGVTSLYRKYIDLYYADPEKNRRITVSREDLEMLKSLYLRTGISQGYYHKHNGRDMVTISSPAYSGTSDKVLETVREKYLGGELKIKCKLSCGLTLGEPAWINMEVMQGAESKGNGSEDNSDDRIIIETVTGNVVEAASKRPMDKESVLKQLSRLGNTPFEAIEIDINIDSKDKEGIFVPVSELNELRRQLCEKMMDTLLASGENGAVTQGDLKQHPESRTEIRSKSPAESHGHENMNSDFHVLVNTKDQLDAVLDVLSGPADCKEYNALTRVYVDSDVFFSLDESAREKIRKAKNGSDMGLAQGESLELIVALPFVTRTEERFDAVKDLDEIKKKLADSSFDGVLIRNFEQLGFFREKNFAGKVILDYGVYSWNSEAAKLLTECGTDAGFKPSEVSVPLELTIHEAKELVEGIRDRLYLPVSLNVYGKAPMMISAGCIKKTLDNCSGKVNQFNRENMKIQDRMGNLLDVTTNCRNCYNVIWNVHPTSLLGKMENISKVCRFDHYRIDLTTEDRKETMRILKAFILGDLESAGELKNEDFTTGHFKRAVE
ncbi:MAG: U32 family peptidase [Butyrivibrio sp.]|nr:U32 family peptidase [Butyrivibrio sp.]